MPMANNVLIASWLTMAPLILPSLPTTIFCAAFLLLSQTPNPAVHSTTSIGVKFSPFLPPMVPLIPEIDLISVKCLPFLIEAQNYTK